MEKPGSTMLVKHNEELAPLSVVWTSHTPEVTEGKMDSCVLLLAQITSLIVRKHYTCKKQGKFYKAHG